MKLWFCILLFSLSCLTFAQTPFIEIEAGKYDRVDVPIYIDLGDELKYDALLNLETKDTIFLATPQLDNYTHFFLLDQVLAKGKSRKYQLLSIDNQFIGYSELQSKSYKKSLKLEQTGQVALTYNFGLHAPTYKAPDYYKRSGFIHPVYTPNGIVLTDDFPIGHTHQNGIFNAWVNTTFKGRKVDFWNRQKQTGKVSSQGETKDVALWQHKNRSQSFRDTLLHIAVDTNLQSEQIVLKEIQHLTLYTSKEYHLFDIYSKQINTSKDTLFVNQYHYGGMAFRGSKFWNEEDSLHFESTMKIITSEGKNRAESNHTRPNWICAYGEIEGKDVGIAIFSHPSNFRSPQFVRVHPKMPYFCFTPTVEKGFSIAPKERYDTQFRFVAFDGAPNLELLERLWLDYAFPVEIKVQ